MSERTEGAHFYLARHGRTVWHEHNRYAGSSDVDLDGDGREQALRLADWAATEVSLDRIAVSPLRRARDTAAPVAERTGLVPVVDERLREQDFGTGEGRTLDDLVREAPEVARGFDTDPVAHPFPGAEPPEAAAERAVACLDELARGGGSVLVVAHGTLLRLVLCTVLGLPLREYRRLFPEVRNTAVTELRWHDRHHVGLLAFNAKVR
ncbi:histidine phosphatase family protein [Allonocardiopsis opalescens]|uniref:Putative phosphoglycerate mutase n=1 Tax=Allonocardiopsis opalescens TaxID=1144618 RepID=A0A2T0Q3T1_9ACTN|nr:histidine phosphatase family protein [Allonocardiopsis opalescens]PRX98462.1 putative phosphoglycerate mutase [Allonocardiopsis opalescens]